jgi:hypothetical protein
MPDLAPLATMLMQRARACRRTSSSPRLATPCPRRFQLPDRRRNMLKITTLDEPDLTEFPCHYGWLVHVRILNPGCGAA